MRERPESASQQPRVRQLSQHDRSRRVRVGELRCRGALADHTGDSGPMDATGALPGVGEFEGVDGLEAGLLSRPELFAGRVTEKLLTFALGRGVEFYDAPAIRTILRDVEPDGYRFSSLVLGIVKSVPFQMRNST